MRLKIHAGSDDPEQTPIIERIHIGGKRVLNADSGSNGWELSPGVEVVNGLLNATAVTGTITLTSFTHLANKEHKDTWKHFELS